MYENLIVIPRANDRAYIVKVIDEDGTAKDITGWTILFTVKNDIDDPDDDALIQKTATITDPDSLPQGYIELDHDDTDIEEGNYLWDCKIIDDQNKLQNTEKGTFKVVTRVTIRETP